MLTRTSQYAVRALIYLARHRTEGPIPGKRIAAGAGVPGKYASKVLSDLVRAGVLLATRGRSGGFVMARSPRQTRLIDVVSPFEQLEQGWPFGDMEGKDQVPVAVRNRWRGVSEARRRFFTQTSVHDVALKDTKRRPPAVRPRSRS